MQQYIFVLGRTPQLAFIELSQLFESVVRLSPSFAILNQSLLPSLSPENILDITGGTTKIALYLKTVSLLDAPTLVSCLDTSGGPVTFGLSLYDNVEAAGLAQAMKKELQKNNVSARYIEARDSTAISSVVWEKEHVQEVVIGKSDKGYVIGKVLAVQPYEAWNTRDYGRPYADPKLGMLPPKVSRMAVNCALGLNAKNKLLLDPFCGMGTVLSEALLRGARVIGSDLSEEVVKKATDNILWLTKTYKQIAPDSATLMVADATHVSKVVPLASVDAIVTEPFMGDTRVGLKEVKPDREKIKNTIKGLEKLYIGCLKDWYAVLKPGGTICMAFPEYSVDGRAYFVKKVIDTCENFGYTKQTGPIEYSRPQAVVKREFFLLTKAV
jgi:tRNA G10  N-methylase Trm11